VTDEPRQAEAGDALRVVKLVHTVVWAIFAACIFAIPVAAGLGQVTLAFVFITIVAVEVVVLVAHRFRCPLTDVAARYTDDRRANFDIYLPLWLARYNKLIFGALYIAGVLFTSWKWLGAGHAWRQIGHSRESLAIHPNRSSCRMAAMCPLPRSRQCGRGLS
jgi:hypothetical protein